ncbi:MoaD/ThiS family protein [Novosphingobium resinovorum]|uniref:MoaD/ThiS family protein n=1 Tax=Novosphingobium resinovorum TaxID=158500 RepID=UPI002ED03C19|nr:MoaD/ThiS family protein [Novosphingobium resinovorum]
MQAKLVFLGRLEEMAGRPFQDIAASAPLDWTDVIGWLGDCCSTALLDAVRGEKVRVAINGALVADKEGLILSDGDELAFLPPVSGG